MRIAWTVAKSPHPIGRIGLGVTDAGALAYLSFGARFEPLEAAADRLRLDVVADHGAAEPIVDELDEYFRGARRRFDTPVDWTLTSGVQRQVLQTLYHGVDYGQTVTYGELAARSGAFAGAPHDRALGARAVGGIMGSNPVPIVVPCHRVLAADGLGGFGGGIAVKQWLLAVEGVLPAALELF
jgi:methylated-DNA-[protein]-cysteine S-methyltransferase